MFEPIEAPFPNLKRETLFEQVGRQLTELIRKGQWKPGDMLPNEIDLAHQFSVSQGTMRRALNILVESGVLIRRQGRGTFVAEFHQHEDMVYRRYIRLEPDDPKTTEPSPSEMIQVAFEKVVAPKRIAKALELPPDTPLIHAVRCLKANGEFVTYDELWLNPVDFEALTAESLIDHPEKMLYAFYQRACGVTITNKQVTAKAVLMPDILCRQFGLRTPLPVVEVRSLAFATGNRPVEYRLQLSVTDRYHYRMD